MTFIPFGMVQVSQDEWDLMQDKLEVSRECVMRHFKDLLNEEREECAKIADENSSVSLISQKIRDRKT